MTTTELLEYIARRKNDDVIALTKYQILELINNSIKIFPIGFEVEDEEGLKKKFVRVARF